MQSRMLALSMAALAGIVIGTAYSQEVGLATFQESAQIVVDKSISQNITASITLQSTSIQEIMIPAELEQKIRENDRIKAVILTNQEQCILGVVDKSCIMINVSRNPEDRGIIAIQDSTREIADQYIDDINGAFDTEAEFHSVFVHTDGGSNDALETSGVVSGRGTISAVYTMPMEDTHSMYEKISALLLPKVIREGGGFYDVARKISSEENAKTTFSVIPLDSKSLLQLRLSLDYPNGAAEISEISPLEFLKVENLKRSEYFSAGFYPLNSIIQVVVLSPHSTNVSGIRGDVVPTQVIDNEKIPTDVTREGWIFDPQKGERIQGKYIFGSEPSVNKQKLEFSLGGESEPAEVEFDESVVIAVIIAIVAAGAAVFYLKGYRK